MSVHEFSDSCDGCRPVILDAKGQMVPDSDPMMQHLNAIWDGASLAERQAYHRVTCQNSRAVEDLAVVERMMRSLRETATP